VLTIACDANLRYTSDEIDFHDVIYIKDSAAENLSRYFHRIFNFIESARRQTNVLVHCIAGVSRSASAIISYLMKKFGWDCETAELFTL